MLTLRIDLSDAGCRPATSAAAVGFGDSYVEPFATNQLETSVRESADGAEIWIGEGPDPFPAAGAAPSRPDDYRGHAVHEGVKLFVSGSDAPPAVSIARTGTGGTPLYITSHGRILYASWRFEHAAQNTPRKRPNKEACRLYLAHGDGQVREQVIEGMFMLWPGERLVFDDSGLSFEQAARPDIVLPNTLTESARVTEEFLYLVAEAMRPNLARSNQPIVELSGGYDSSCVAIAARSATDRLNSYGLVHQGAMGIQQRKRRRELVDLLGVNDFEFPSWEHTPLASLEVPECSLTLVDDNHRLPCAYAVDAHPAKGLDLILTGVGGDELTMENTFQRREWEVAGNVCTSALVTAAARADMFMRRGIWPKNPLAAQAVVDFCRALPAKLRSGRLLNILTLARSGLSDGFLFPRYLEHYGAGMQHEAALYDFDAQLTESIVADYGITDLTGLLRRAREAGHGGFSYKLIFELFTLLKLEKVLRRYCS
ncbi:MAG TPA: asparagine synthase-related protein [Allosphingosinicella sp.]